MSEKLERDIEEVLEKIDDFSWHRRQRRGRSRVRRMWAVSWQRASDVIGGRLASLAAGHVMLAGFLLLLLGLVLRAKGPGIWFVLAGVLIFFLGLAWSMRDGNVRSGRGGYWRDRYITYDGPQSGGVRGWFRRWRN